MAQTVYDEVFDGSGKLISRTERVAPDPEPTPAERIAALEARLAAVDTTLDAVGKAGTFAEAKTAISTRQRVDFAELPVKGGA